MSKNNRPIFAEDSDADSVATDSTQESDQEESYSVDHILAEDHDYEGTGTIAYLLKWEGYPVYRATWEPPENIDDQVLIRQWEDEKQLIREGKKKPFDVVAFDQDLGRRHDEKDERRRRRNEKRRKRGLPLSSVRDGGEDYEDEMDVEGSPKRRRLSTQVTLDSGDEDVIEAAKPTRTRRVTSAPVKRKGIARKFSGSRHGALSSSEDGELWDEDGSSEPNSLFDEGSQPIYPELAKPKKPMTRPGMPVKSGASARPNKPPTSAPTTTKSVAPPKTTATLAARKSAPVPVTTAKATNTGKMTAKRTNIFANWDDPSKKGKQRARVSGVTPKNSTDPKFCNLSTQNRMQKYSRNEPAPNLNALTIVDPRTGMAQPGKAAPAHKLALAPLSVPTATSRDPEEIHSAYGRRSPPRQRQRSITPPTSEPRRAQNQAIQLQVQTAGGQPVPPSKWRRTETCFYWLDGTCQRTAETCRYAHWAVDAQSGPPPPPPPPIGYADKKLTTCFYWQQKGRCNRPTGECEFAHHDTGIYSKSYYENNGDTGTYSKSNYVHKDNITCHFWRQGRCNKSDEQCDFAHHDTGVYAGQPGTFKKGANAVGAQSFNNGARIMRSSSGITGANAVPVGGSSFPSIDTTIMQASTPPLQSATTDRGDRAVRFQLPDTDSGPPPRPSTVDSGSLPVRITIASEDCGQPLNMDADLHMSGYKKFEALLYPIAEGVHLHADRMVTASDMQTLQAGLAAVGPQWPAGAVAPHAGSLGTVDKLVECCKLHASGFVWVRDHYTLLIYPSNSDEWRFIDSGATPAVQNASLRFRMFPPPTDYLQTKPTTVVAESSSLQQQPSVIVGKAILGLDSKKIIQRSEDLNMFVAWPVYRYDELSVLVRYLDSIGCKVYHSGTPGAWAHFRGQYPKGVVIVHPETPLWEIPKLHSFIVAHDAKFFSIGMHHSPMMLGDQKRVLTCKRLFPHGRVIFITDDIFMYHPEKATEIMNSFVEASARKPIGGENDRIAARPGVKEWLRKLAQEHTAERGRPDLRWLNLYESICKLCPPEAEDPDDLPNPLPSSNLVSIPAEELPSFYGLWEQNEDRATDMMVEWFAGWSALSADRFRRFFVCFEPRGGEIVQDENGRFRVDADPRGWSKKYQHIGVMRPDDFTKKSKVKK